jgi:hypothetical protein
VILSAFASNADFIQTELLRAPYLSPAQFEITIPGRLSNPSPLGPTHDAGQPRGIRPTPGIKRSSEAAPATCVGAKPLSRPVQSRLSREDGSTDDCDPRPRTHSLLPQVPHGAVKTPTEPIRASAGA